jgi:hypothetical protein
MLFMNSKLDYVELKDEREREEREKRMELGLNDRK